MIIIIFVKIINKSDNIIKLKRNKKKNPHFFAIKLEYTILINNFLRKRMFLSCFKKQKRG